MDIQEAIQHCMDVAAGATEQGKCPECAADHEQLAGWLTVLKQIAEIFNCDPNDPAQLKQLCDKLRNWQQAEQAGRLVVPPCKAGDTIYQLRDKRHARGAGISPRIVSYVGVWRQDYAAFHQGAVPCYKQDLGKTWFLTEKDAKVALEAAKTTKEEI